MQYWKLPPLVALLAVFGLAFAIACGSGDDSSEESETTLATDATSAPKAASLTFQLNWIPNIQHFGPVYADKMGFYKEANLNVKVQAGGQGVDGLALVVGGGADIAVSSATSIYAANEKGADLVAFAAVYQKAANALVCRGDSGIVKFSDIEGKKIGSKGPSDDDSLPILFNKNGVDPKSVKIVPIGASSITELIAGLVDCQLAFAVNEPVTLKKAGIEPVIFKLADYGIGGQGEVYFTRREYFDKNQDVLVRFLQATAKAWDVYLDDPQAAADWIVNSKIVDGLDLEQQKAQAVLQADLIADDYTEKHGLLYINEELWKEQAQQALEQGRITKIPALDTARSYAILDAAKLKKR